MVPAKLYSELFQEYTDESAVLRAERYADWSLPTVFTDTTMSANGRQQSVERDFQSVGAMLVNSLSSKLVGLLFPANQSFFRIDTSESPEAMASAMAVSASGLTSALATLETTAYRRLFLKASYAQLVHALKLVIVTGNALVYRDSAAGTLHVHSMRSYSLKRGGSGRVLDIVLREFVAVQEVPDEFAAKYRGRRPTETIPLYTRIQYQMRDSTGVYVVTQQLEDQALDTLEEYPEAICPYIPVTWNLITGEDYGRGLVEDYAGAFAKLSSLSEAVALYEIEMARVLHLVQMGSGGDIDDAATAESGRWLQLSPEKVQAYEAGDYNKLNALLGDIQQLTQQLAPAFMYTGNVRDAERVTAEEIRMQAREADQSMGGNYSALADNLHIPLAHILCWEVNPEFISELIRGGVSLSVLTGVSALGRSTDISNLIQAAQVLSTVLPVLTQAGGQFDPARISQRVFEGYGIDITDYQFTEEELQAQAEQNNAEATAPSADMAGVADIINTSGVL